MTYQNIIKGTFRKFYIPTAINTLGLALMNILNIVFAGVFFGETGSFIIGLTLPIVILMEVISFFFGVGSGVAISTFLGIGEKEKASDTFTLSLFFTVAIGLILAASGYFLIDGIMVVLGVRDAGQILLARSYVLIMIIGIPVHLLSSVLNVLVRNDNDPKNAMRGAVSGSVMCACLILFFIKVQGLGIEYIALSIVVSRIASIAVYVFHFKSENSALELKKSLNLSVFYEIFKPGFAGSMIFFAQMILTLMINHVLMTFNGADGIATYGIIKYIITLIYAVYDGVNHSAQPMFSVFSGERDNESIVFTAKTAFSLLIAVSAVITCTLVFAAPFISTFFNVDVSSAVFFIAASVLFSSIVTFLNSYYRSTGKFSASLLIVILNNLILPALLVYFTVYVLGFTQNGVWISLFMAEVITLTVILCLYRKNILLLKDVSISPDKIYKTLIQNKETDIVAITDEIKEFCDKNGVAPKKQFYIFLCLEEIAVNIIKHGFADDKEHYIDIRLSIANGIANGIGNGIGSDVTMSIRDDAVQFDPTLKSDVDVTKSAEERDIGGLGIYLVKKIAKEFSYKRVIGFNSLHIVL